MHSNTIALVTEANKGIGLQIARELVEKGFIVLIGACRIEAGKVAAETIDGEARAIQLDVTDQDSIDGAARYIRDTFGHLDVLVNNAGITHTGKPGRTMEEVVQ